MAESYNAGIVTAFGAAVRGGYTGTYEQWCQDMADLGDNIAEVRQKAAQVSQDAQTVAADKATVAQDAQTVAADKATVAADKTAAQTAAQNAEISKTNAAGSATQAGESAGSAAQSATEAAASAAEAKRVEESIPESYEELSAEVGDLKSALNDVEETVGELAPEIVGPQEESIDIAFNTNGLIDANRDTIDYGKVYIPLSQTSWIYSEYISCEKYEKISISMPKTTNRSDAGIVFYSDNVVDNVPSSCVAAYRCNSGASSTASETRSFDIPQGAKYFRTSYLSTLSNFSCIGYWNTSAISIDMLRTEVMQLATNIGNPMAGNIAEIESIAVKVSDFDDGIKTDDEIISDAMAFASSYSSRYVLFDTKDWHISQAILLDANTTVVIDGVKIKQNDGTYDNVFRGKNFVVNDQNPNMFAQSITDTENISIIGKNGAIIEGPDVNATIYNPYLQETQAMVGDYYGWRTLQIYLCNCTGIEISGISFTKTRCWAISFEFCANAHVHDLNFETLNIKNGDGIDIRIGCHNFYIHDITGKTEDDAVACTALYPGYNKDSYNPQQSATMYPLTASHTGESLQNVDKRLLDIHDVIISNVYTAGRHHAIICLCANGLRVYNVGINNVVEQATSSMESVVKVYTGYASSWASGTYADGDLHKISAGTIIANGANYTFLCNCKVADVYLNKLIQNVSGKDIYSIAYNTGITITNTNAN